MVPVKPGRREARPVPMPLCQGLESWARRSLAGPRRIWRFLEPATPSWFSFLLSFL